MKDKQRSTSQVEDKHTPGPWHVKRGNGIYAKDQYIGLSLRGLTYDKGLPYKANARLMAAAPELLEFVRYVAKGIPVGDDPCSLEELEELLDHLEERAKRLIDKIEGDE